METQAILIETYFLARDLVSPKKLPLPLSLLLTR
jgi:hypothetical protein